MYRYRRSPSYVFDCKCDRPQKKGRQESPSVRMEKQKVLSCINHCTSLYSTMVLSKVPDNFRATLPPSSTNQSRT